MRPFTSLSGFPFWPLGSVPLYTHTLFVRPAFFVGRSSSSSAQSGSGRVDGEPTGAAGSGAFSRQLFARAPAGDGVLRGRDAEGADRAGAAVFRPSQQVIVAHPLEKTPTIRYRAHWFRHPPAAAPRTKIQGSRGERVIRSHPVASCAMAPLRYLVGEGGAASFSSLLVGGV